MKTFFLLTGRVMHLFLVTILCLGTQTGQAQFQIGNLQEAATNINISGVYKVNDGGICYVQQTEKRAFFFMEFPGKYSYVVKAWTKPNGMKLKANSKVDASWYALPKYSQKGQGQIKFTVINANKIALQGLHGFPGNIKGLTRINIHNPNYKKQLPQQVATPTYKHNKSDILDGLWKANSNLNHYVYNKGGNFVWFGESKFNKGQQPAYAGIFVGTYNKNTKKVSGKFVNLPKSMNTSDKEVPLEMKLESATTLKKLSGSMLIGQWKRTIWVDPGQAPGGVTTGNNLNLNRVYKVNDGSGILYLREFKGEVRGFMESPTKQYAHAIKGTVNGNKLNLQWWDVPKYKSTTKGSISFNIQDNGAKLSFASGKAHDFKATQLVAVKVTKAIIQQFPLRRYAAYAATDQWGDTDGVWNDHNGIRYYFREVDGNVIYYAESAFSKGNQPKESFVFFGKRGTSHADKNKIFNRSNDKAKVLGELISGRYTQLPKARLKMNSPKDMYQSMIVSKSIFARERIYQYNNGKVLKRNCIMHNDKPKAKPAANKRAAIALFYYDDGFFFTLAQNAGVNLNWTMTGYDKTVLLKEKILKNYGQNISGQPTSTNLLKYMKQLANEGYYIDLYLFTHGSKTGVSLKDGVLTPNELRQALGHIYGKGKFPIRMVYQGLCWGSEMNDAFIDLGAKVTAGSRYVNFLPFRYNGFGKAWNNGNTFEKAIIESRDEKGIDGSGLIKAGLESQYDVFHIKNKGKYGCDLLGESLKESKHCIRMFLEQEYSFEPHYWQGGKSGWEQIYYSSHKLIKGDPTITKYTKPTW